MTALCIIGGIFLLFFGIAMIRAEVIIKYADDFGLAVRVCGIKITIMPRKQKKNTSVRLFSEKARKAGGKRKEESRKGSGKEKRKGRKKGSRQSRQSGSKKSR